MFMWKNKNDNYYAFNLDYNDRYNFCNPIELFQIKDRRSKNVNIIIIYETKKGFINKDSHKYTAKIKSKHPLSESHQIEVGSYSKILSGDDLFILKWECVTKISKLGWDISKDFLSFVKGDTND